jgi:hypothetical protein
MKIDNKFIAKTGDFIVANKKPLMYIGGAIALVAVGYAVVSRFTKGVGGFLTDKSVGVSKFVPIKIDLSKATISDETANAYANQLFNAMKDAGTNSSLIGSVFDKISKKEDFLKVYNAFGIKSHGYWGEPTLINYVVGYDNYDLVEWLEAEIGNFNPLTWTKIKKTVNNAGFSL